MQQLKFQHELNFLFASEKHSKLCEFDQLRENSTFFGMIQKVCEKDKREMIILEAKVKNE